MWLCGLFVLTVTTRATEGREAATRSVPFRRLQKRNADNLLDAFYLGGQKRKNRNTLLRFAPNNDNLLRLADGLLTIEIKGSLLT